MKRLIVGVMAAACALIGMASLAAQATAQTFPQAQAPAGQWTNEYGQCAGRLSTYCAPLSGVVITDSAVNRSTTITAGGTAQTLLPVNATRLGWEIENQSNDNCYIRSMGPLGTTVATTDQNSLLIYPGQDMTPSHVSSYALSIVCPTTGDKIYAREW